MIYIERKLKNNFQEFLVSCLRGNNYLGSIRTFDATYQDPNFQNVQCGPGSSRTLRDITILINTYYPDVTEDEIIKFLFEGTEELHFVAAFCNGVGRLVFKGKNEPRTTMDFYKYDYDYDDLDKYIEDWDEEEYSGIEKDMKGEDDWTFYTLKQYYLTELKNKEKKKCTEQIK